MNWKFGRFETRKGKPAKWIEHKGKLTRDDLLGLAFTIVHKKHREFGPASADEFFRVVQDAFKRGQLEAECPKDDDERRVWATEIYVGMKEPGVGDADQRMRTAHDFMLAQTETLQ